MPIVKQDRVMPFHLLHRGSPFAFTTTIYSQTNGEEKPKEHIFYKCGSNKAKTLDGKYIVYFGSQDNVVLCKQEKK
jgi:hypothetical protein